MREFPMTYYVPVSGRFEYQALKRLKALFPGVPVSHLVERGLEDLLKNVEVSVGNGTFDASFYEKNHALRGAKIDTARANGKDWWRH